MDNQDEVTDALLLVIGLLVDRIGGSSVNQRLEDLESWRAGVEAVWEDIIDQVEG